MLSPYLHWKDQLETWASNAPETKRSPQYSPALADTLQEVHRRVQGIQVTDPRLIRLVRVASALSVNSVVRWKIFENKKIRGTPRLEDMESLLNNTAGRYLQALGAGTFQSHPYTILSCINNGIAYVLDEAEKGPRQAYRHLLRSHYPHETYGIWIAEIGAGKLQYLADLLLFFHELEAGTVRKPGERTIVSYRYTPEDAFVLNHAALPLTARFPQAFAKLKKTLLKERRYAPGQPRTLQDKPLARYENSLRYDERKGEFLLG